MQMRMTVHSAAPCPVRVTAKFEDRDVLATVPGLVVELVNLGHTFTLKLVPASPEEMAEFIELFTVGGFVDVPFIKGE